MTAQQIKQMEKHFSLVPNHELVAMYRVSRAPAVREVVEKEVEKRGLKLTPNAR